VKESEGTNRKAPRRVLSQGLPEEGNPELFFPVTIITSGDPAVKRRKLRPGYHFAGTPRPLPPPESVVRNQPAKQYRNPTALAREWQETLTEGKCASRADLARELGVSRARVTQVFSMLDLAPDVVSAVGNFGDPLPEPMVGERRLRLLTGLPLDEQRRVWQVWMAAPDRPKE